MARLANISDVCNEIFAGGDAPKNNMSIEKTDEFSIPIYSNGEAENGLYGYTNFARVTEPSITISARGTIGFAAIRNEPFVPIVRLITLTPNPTLINIRYLYYAVQNYHFNGSGTSIPQLTVPMLKQYSFPLPEIEKQIHISAILDKLSNLISLRKQQLAKLDELVKVRFVEMFGTLTTTKFSVKTLNELCLFIKDGTHQTPTYTEDSENGIKFLSSKDVTSGQIDWTKIKYIPQDLHEELYARIAPQRGDILLAKNGTTGIPAIVDTDDVFDIYVSLALLRFKDGNNITYLWAALSTLETKRQFDSSLKGIGVPNLHLSEIKKAKIIVPPIELQNKFSSFVEKSKRQKLTIQKSLDKLEVLKKSLMQEYFG